MSQKSFSSSERALIGLGVIVPTLALLGVVVWNRSEAFTPIAIPTLIPLAGNNAHTTLKTATQQEVSKLNGIEVSPRKGKMQEQPLGGRQALLAANQPALATVRTALEQPYQQPLNYTVSQLFPEFAQDRELARLLYFAGKTYEDSQQLSEAARCYTDAMMLGEKLPHGNTLIGMLVGIACEAIGRRGLWEVSETLDAATLRTVIERLEALENSRAPLTDAFTAEKWMAINELQRFLKTPSTSYVTMAGSNANKLGGAVIALQVARIGKKRIHTDCLRYWDSVINDANLPYSPNRPAPKPPTDPLNAIFCGEFSQAGFKLTQTQAETRLLIVSLALRLYALEHDGKRPESLEKLGWFQKFWDLPDDPFSGAARKPFGYEPSTGKLYSVGPDGDDDKGRAIIPEKTGKDGKPVHYVESGQEGDMVARINTY